MVKINLTKPILIIQVPKRKYTQVWLATNRDKLIVRDSLFRERKYINLPNGIWELVNTEDVKIFFKNIIKITVQLKKNTRKFLAK